MKKLKDGDLKNIDYQVKTDELIKEVLFLRQFGVSVNQNTYSDRDESENLKEKEENEI